MLLLGIDLETSGTDPQKDRILEIGAVIWDCDRDAPVKMMSELIDPGFDGDAFIVSPEIEEITGISTSMISEWGQLEDDILKRLQEYAEVERVGYIVAHFGNDFDRPFLQAAYKRNILPFPHQGWLDTSIDVVYPPRIKTRNLRHLAAEHNFLNSFSHRAVFDVLTMLKILSQYDLEVVIARSLEPTIYVQALVEFKNNQLAKDRSYRWCPSKKIWWKQFKASDFEAERQDYGFSTQFLTEAPE